MTLASLRLAYWCQDNTYIIREFNINSTSILNIRKQTFSEARFHINVSL